MKTLYQRLFGTADGQAVLADLERIINATRLDANDPNPNSAIWKCAQLNLVQRIRNQTQGDAE
jgi:hypothetical protein